MSKETKLYILSGKTKIIVNNYNLPSIRQVIPSIKDIINHIQVQIGQKEFRPIVIEVSKDKLEEINIDIRKKSCQNLGYSKVAIYLESYTSNKVLPIIQIIEKR